MEMEAFRKCPICMEVPAAEIYQCFAGHYICDVCIAKVSGDLCPQCKVPFGSPKIRNRVLEQLLDRQEFGCKFSEQGCTHLSKRGELANHSDSCSHNRNQVPLCQLLRDSDCEFKLGLVSKSEIVDHFTQWHGRFHGVTSKLELRLDENKVKEMLNKKRKHSLISSSEYLTTPNGMKTAPLFLVQQKVDKLAGFVSFVVVKIWESDAHPVSNYMVNVTFKKGKASASQSNSAQGASSAIISTVNPFPMNWKWKVSSLKEAQYVLKVLPVVIPIPLFVDEECGKPGGEIKLEITPRR